MAALIKLSTNAVVSLRLADVATDNSTLLVPVTASSLFVLFPAGCRRVELSIGRAISLAVWPALWPAAVMLAYIELTRPLVPTTLFGVGAETAAALLIYAATFLLFGISPAERRFYVAKLTELVGRSVPTPPLSEGA